MDSRHRTTLIAGPTATADTRSRGQSYSPTKNPWTKLAHPVLARVRPVFSAVPAETSPVVPR